jgi:hypothetical protein
MKQKLTALEIKRTNKIFDVLWAWRLEQIDTLPQFVRSTAEGYAPTRDKVIAIAVLAMKADDEVLKGSK